MKRLRLSKNTWLSIAVVLLLGLALATGGVLAKYAQTLKNKTAPFRAKGFYFESDYLKDTTPTPVYKLNSNTESVSFLLRNYENSYRVSEVDCTYTVTVTTSDPSFTIDGAAVSTKTYENIPKSVATDTPVTLGGLSAGYSYQVTATSQGGYVKTLSATFEIEEAKGGFYMNVQQPTASEPYVVLKVWTDHSESVTGTVTISVPAGLIPDERDPILEGVDNYQGGSYVATSFADATSFVTAPGEHKYIFFITAQYDPSQPFTVTMEGEHTAAHVDLP